MICLSSYEFRKADQDIYYTPSTTEAVEHVLYIE